MLLKSPIQSFILSKIHSSSTTKVSLPTSTIVSSSSRFQFEVNSQHRQLQLYNPRHNENEDNDNLIIHNNKKNVSSSRRESLTQMIIGCCSIGIISVPTNNNNIANAASSVLLPDIGEISNSVPSDWDDDTMNPFLDTSDPKSFARLDESPDEKFYTDARFVEHVDENCVALMSQYIQSQLKENDSVLDLCSSWTSHISETTKDKLKLDVYGLGMNEQELKANTVLNGKYIVQDLNSQPNLTFQQQYKPDMFDVVLCQLSIDYLTKPGEVLSEVHKTLKPGGKIHILFSNRLFLSKAVGLWTGKDDIDHAFTVASYLKYCGKDFFMDIKAIDLSTRKKGKIVGDPLYVVSAMKPTKK